MKRIHQGELELIVEDLRDRWLGAQLQDVYSHPQGLILCLYKNENAYLIFDLDSVSPFFGVFPDSSPWSKSRVIKPLSLFLNSHAVPLRLDHISVDSSRGRVVEFEFRKGERECRLELTLVPGRSNLVAQFEKKKISWAPVEELPPASHTEEKFPETRSPRKVREDWMQDQKTQPRSQTSKTSGGEKSKALAKKQKAMGEIQKKLIEQSENQKLFYELGEKLKSHSLTEMSADPHIHFLDLRRSQAWNRENCFEKAKALQKKQEGARQRLDVLTQEIQKLEKDLLSSEGKDPSIQVTSTSGKGKHKIFSQENLRLRKKELSKGAVGFIGKSAKDNLQLLREARAWDLWLHLRDYPGAHGILRREKNQKISDGDLKIMARWLAQESLNQKKILKGTKLEVVCTECRFVRPIKGDRLGRVNYHSENHFFVLWE